MNVEELSSKYGYSVSAITTKWPRTQKNILEKTGVLVEKKGRGKNVEFVETFPASRAETMYEETKEEMIVDRSSLHYESVEFHCFLAVIMTQFMTFRGKYEDLVRYMGLQVNKNNIGLVKNGVGNLVNRGILSFYEDCTTDEGYFILSLVRKAEVEMRIGIDMVRTCKRIAEENHKRDYIPLLKIWLGMQVMSENQPFTLGELEQLTGLTAYQVREGKKLLEKDNLFKTTRAYTVAKKCVGNNVLLNAFEEDNRKIKKDYESH